MTDLHTSALANFHDGMETYTIFYIDVEKNRSPWRLREAIGRGK